MNIKHDLCCTTACEGLKAIWYLRFEHVGFKDAQDGDGENITDPGWTS